jgi:hypothetical protein
MGFTANLLEKCVFNKWTDSGSCTLAIHVDDAYIYSDNKDMLTWVENELLRIYKKVTFHKDDVINYLGMQLDFKEQGKCTITMKKYITDLLEDLQVVGTSTTPSSDDLFRNQDDMDNVNDNNIDDTNDINNNSNIRNNTIIDSDISNNSNAIIKHNNNNGIIVNNNNGINVNNELSVDNDDKEMYHSTVARLLYLAKRIRPDILLTISYLTTRVLAPSRSDLAKLFRVLKYINGTKELAMILQPNNSNKIEIYVDASYGIHSDGKSHTGMCIKHGNGTIECKSTKQRINTKSSTESELIALSDMSTTAIWVNDFIQHQHYKLSTTVIYQDNKSTITMINNGNNNKERTRHINLRYFWLRDRIKSGEIIVTYKQTSDMIADILTKTIQGKQFTYLRGKLLNTPCTSDPARSAQLQGYVGEERS